MHWPIIFGFVGDALTFAGGVLLARDAILKECEFKNQKELVKTINSLKNVTLTMDGVKLIGEDSATIVFIRQSVRRSIVGTIILTAGFVGLFLSRLCEVMHWGAGAT